MECVIYCLKLPIDSSVKDLDRAECSCSSGHFIRAWDRLRWKLELTFHPMNVSRVWFEHATNLIVVRATEITPGSSVITEQDMCAMIHYSFRSISIKLRGFAASVVPRIAPFPWINVDGTLWPANTHAALPSIRRVGGTSYGTVSAGAGASHCEVGKDAYKVL